MENHLSTNPGSVIIHFIPGGPIDAAARKAIRSHVTLDARRKQRERKLLSLQTKPSKPKGPCSDDNLCKCFIFESLTHGLPLKQAPKSRAALHREQIADSYKICPQCRCVQFWALSPQGQLRIVAKMHPTIVHILQSVFDPLDSMPEVPNLPPYGSQIINDIKVFLITFMTPGHLKTAMFTAAQTPSVLMGVLYFGCWNLAALRDDYSADLMNVAAIIKREAIRQINSRLLDPTTACTVETIASIGWLSAGIMCAGESTALEEITAHEQGLSLLINRGPTWNPGEDQVLGRALVKLLILHEFTRAAIFDVPIEEQILIQYGQVYPSLSKIDNSAESPLFRPLDDFYSIKRAKDCSEKLFGLLHAVADLVDATMSLAPILEDDNTPPLVQYESAKSALDALLSNEEENPMHIDYIYKCCRLAALLTARHIDTGTPFSELDEAIVGELKAALKKTDIGNTWGQLSGVLLWICLVGVSAATIGKPQHGYFDTLLRLTMNALVYSSPVFEASTIATANFVKIKNMSGIPRIRAAALQQASNHGMGQKLTKVDNLLL